MGFRLRKSINLGGGMRLNLSRKGVGVSAGVKGFRVSAGPRGVTGTASIPGTGLGYSKTMSLSNSKKSTTSHYIEYYSSSYSNNSNSSPHMDNIFLPMNIPSNLKSRYYGLQRFLGYLSWFFLIGSFSNFTFFIIAAACFYARYGWRKITDKTALSYKKAFLKYRTKSYSECISALDTVLTHPKANQNLMLIKSECFLNINDTAKALETYKIFFSFVSSLELNGTEYLLHKVKAIQLLIDNKEFDEALRICQSLPETETNGSDLATWKNYLKGLCFLVKEQYETANIAFRNAIGRKRNMEEPLIHCHYYLGTVYLKQGDKVNANKAFQKVYAANPTYKNINQIIETLNSEDTIDINIS